MPLDLHTLSLPELESLMKVHLAGRPEPTWALGVQPPLHEVAAWQKKLGPWNDRKDQIQYHLDLKTMVISKPFVKAEDMAPEVAAELDAHLAPPPSHPTKAAKKAAAPPQEKRKILTPNERLALFEKEEAEKTQAFEAGDREAYLRIRYLRHEIAAVRNRLHLPAVTFQVLPRLQPWARVKATPQLTPRLGVTA